MQNPESEEPSDESKVPSEPNSETSEIDNADLQSMQTLRASVPQIPNSQVDPTGVYSAFGYYRILQSIGKGGMGQVFMAEQKEPVRRRVALKVIKTDTPTKEILARFEAERQALAMMDHHNIAKVLDAGVTDDGRPYFAMELVKGVPITEYCDANKLSPAERLELFIQICRAIEHAHGRGVLHRDIKPSNVLVTTHDGKATAKVIDFGLAKAVHDTTQLTDRTLFTEFGQVVGTLAYMSPEQAEMNAADVDRRTDVYSLGVILYELLTGSTPITKEQIKAEAFDRILALIREEDAPRPSTRLSSSGEKVSSISEQRNTEPHQLGSILKGDLDWIAVKALEKNRTRRYNTPSELADDVQRFLSKETVQARPPSIGYRLQKACRRHRNGILTTATILTLGIGLAITGLMLLRESNRNSLGKNSSVQPIDTSVEKSTSQPSDGVESKLLEAETLARKLKADSIFQLANARWNEHRVAEARRLLCEIPVEFRNTPEWNLCYRQFQGSDITFYGHNKPATCLAISPSGEVLVSGSADHTLKIWNAVSGKVLANLKGHQEPITSVAFSPNGLQIASCSADHTVKIWDAVSYKLVASYPETTERMTQIAFSPNGETLAIAGANGTVKTCDLNNGEMAELAKVETEVTSLAYSLDGKTLAVGCQDFSIHLWSVATVEKVATLEGHSGVVTDLEFSPNGLLLASASSDQSIQLWNTSDWKNAKTIEGHPATIHSARFRPDGTEIVATCVDHSIHLYSVNDGSLIRSFYGHIAPVNCAVFSSDGGRFFSASDDNTLKVWTLKSGAAHKGLEGLLGLNNCLAFSPDGDEIIAANTTIKAWNVTTGKEVRELIGPTTEKVPSINSLAFSPDGSTILSGGTMGSIQFWDAQTGEVLQSPDDGNEAKNLTCVAFSPNGLTAASGDTGNDLFLWQLAPRNAKATRLPFESEWVTCIAFSPDGTQIATGEWNGFIRFWDTNTKKEIETSSKIRSGRVFTLTYTPDGSKLISGGFDHTLRIWDTETRQEIMNMRRKHSATVGSVSLSPDGSRMLTASTDTTLKLWDSQTFKELKSISLRNEPLAQAAFSPDGNLIASIGYGGTLDIWDVSDTHETVTLASHSSRVTNATFDTTGKAILANAGTEELVWNSETGSITTTQASRPPKPRLQSGRLSLITSGEFTLVVDTAFKNTPQEDAYRTFKATPKARWHQEAYRDATKANDWFAATFHGAWLLRITPDSATTYHSFHRAYNRLTPEMQTYLPRVVTEALNLPEPTQ